MFFIQANSSIFLRHMKSLLCFIVLLFFSPVLIKAQTDSSAAKSDTLYKDTGSVKKDSVVRDTAISHLVDSILLKDSLKALQVKEAAINKLRKDSLVYQERQNGVSKFFSGKEFLFYYLVFLFLIFGLLRQVFAKYFSDLFRVFFRTTLKQRQIGEQLLQSPLPSICMNAFFVLTAGMYVNFLLQHFHLSVTENFWLQYLYCTGALAVIYIIKFLGLELTGWIFNVREATDAYTLIVFIVNKMMAIMVLPLLVLIAFTKGTVYQSVIILSLIVVAILMAYRFILSYSAARKEIKLNTFHFLLYIFAFELVPLLLIYKLLMIIF